MAKGEAGMTPPAASWLRLLFPILMLVATGAFLYSRSRPELLPSYVRLGAFPMQVGDWRGQDVPIPPDVLEGLGKGDFMERNYSRSETEPPVGLFLAFFPTQRTGATVHSPQHCLPGAGWAAVEHDFLPLMRPTGETSLVNRYVVARESNRQFVLYWYQSHGRLVASEYWGKYYLVSDAICLNRSDGGLVRVATPMNLDESVSQAQERAVAFAEQILPKLNAYIPN
jgi:EpsI family protein